MASIRNEYFVGLQGQKRKLDNIKTNWQKNMTIITETERGEKNGEIYKYIIVIMN